MLFKTIILLLFVPLTLASTCSFEACPKENFKGSCKRYSGSGTYKIGYTVRSYHWDNGHGHGHGHGYGHGNGCCVKMCHGRREVGYWCSKRSNKKPKCFDKVVVVCGKDKARC